MYAGGGEAGGGIGLVGVLLPDAPDGPPEGPPPDVSICANEYFPPSSIMASFCHSNARFSREKS
jgi:hypothetical protein